jgi:hypothetical protein
MKPSLTPVGEYLLRRGTQACAPTSTLVRYWWRRLNIELFDGALHEHDFYVLQLEQNARAQSDGEDIWIDPMCNTKALLIGTLAHEMIHQLQWQRSRPLDHGKFFQVQARRLRAALGTSIV